MRNSTIFIALVASGACALAVNLPKEGTWDATSCWTGTSNDMALGKEYTANSYELLGTIVSVTPGGLGDQNSFRCVGSNTTIKGKYTGANVCEATDADGDKRVSRFEILADGKVVREFLLGTGKYEGMQQTTTVVSMPPMKEAKPGTFQGCNRQSGTYKLK
jgi:hypothetical protein